MSGGTQVTRDVNGTSGFIGVSMPVPLFDRGRGPIARATADIAASERALEAEAAEARADLERAATVLAQRREALARFEQTVAGATPALRQMAEDAYREGTADILDLLDSMRAMRDIQLSRIQQLEATTLAEEEVVAAAGLDTPPVTP